MDSGEIVVALVVLLACGILAWRARCFFKNKRPLCNCGCCGEKLRKKPKQ